MAESTSTTTPKPFNFWDMLADDNFQLLLANMGAAAVPEGYAGNVIGKAAANMIRSKAAQRVGEQQLNEDGEVTRKLGPLTPKGTTGPNKISRKSNGSLDIDVDHPDPAKLVDTLGGYTPIGQEGINSLSRTPSGSLLVNYDPPRRKLAAASPIDTELASLEAAPTAARDSSRLSYTPISQQSVQAEIDGILEPWAMRRRVV